MKSFLQKNFKHLERARDNIDNWPRWKRESAGIEIDGPACCCGMYKLENGEPCLSNNTIHEIYGPKENFCGPVDAHTIRDLQKRNRLLEERERACPTMLESEARALYRALQEVAEAVGIDSDISSPSDTVNAVKALVDNIGNSGEFNKFESWLQSKKDYYQEKLNQQQPSTRQYIQYKEMRWACAFVLEKYRDEINDKP